VSNDRWKLVKGIFQRALARPSEEWAAYLDSVCAMDDALRIEVATLLGEHEPAARGLLGLSFVSPSEKSAVDASQAIEPQQKDGHPIAGDESTANVRANRTPRDEPNALLGTFFDEVYYVDKFLGPESGGAVFVARQALIGDRVELKLFDQGHRIEAAAAEARIPRLLMHRALAIVYELRTSRSGRLYLIRERLQGTPLEEALADRPALSLHRRLEILRELTDVVDSAFRLDVRGLSFESKDVVLGSNAGKPAARLRRLASGQVNPDRARKASRSVREDAYEESAGGLACLVQLARTLFGASADRAVETLAQVSREREPLPIEFVAMMETVLAHAEVVNPPSSTTDDITLELGSSSESHRNGAGERGPNGS